MTRKKSSWPRLRSWIWRIVLVLLAIPLLFVGAVWVGLFGALPDRDDLAAIDHHNASLVFAADGTLMGKYFLEDRYSVPVDSLPEHLLQALVATEDARFYSHKGVDWRAMGRVLYRTVLLQDASGGGGSTISQQLAKNLFGRKQGTIGLAASKVREIIVAGRLERTFSKQELLGLYLNTVPFGENVYGIENASWRFFNRPALDLRPEQGAVLVGLLKANTSYSPRLHPEASLQRRNVVLGQMHKEGYLDAGALDSLQSLPLALSYARRGVHEGVAPYFRDRIRREAETLLADIPGPEGRSWNLYTDGLRIISTLDPALQAYAEAAVRAHMPSLQARFASDKGSRLSPAALARHVERSQRYQRAASKGWSETEIQEKFSATYPQTWFSWDGPKSVTGSILDSIRFHQEQLQVGFVLTDPASGRILAWVGGANHRFFGYDHVGAYRPAGSTIKPLIYAAALEQGADPCAWLSAERQVYEAYDDWSPRNADGAYAGFWSMPGALAHSVNTASVQVYLNSDVDSTWDALRRFGLAAEWQPYPSVALGSGNVNALELAEAYAAFSQSGRTRKPYGVTRIETADGQVLVEQNDPPWRDVLSAEHAEQVRYMLGLAVDSGTAAGLRKHYGLAGDLAGKTGTTQDQADGWFVGFSPHLLAAVWVGADDPGLHFTSLRDGQGAAMAMPIWARFWQQAQRDRQYRHLALDRFEPLSAESLEALDCPEWVESPPLPPTFWEELFGPRRNKPDAPRRQEREAPKGKFWRWLRGEKEAA